MSTGMEACHGQNHVSDWQKATEYSYQEVGCLPVKNPQTGPYRRPAGKKALASLTPIGAEYALGRWACRPYGHQVLHPTCLLSRLISLSDKNGPSMSSKESWDETVTHSFPNHSAAGHGSTSLLAGMQVHAGQGLAKRR